jgi:poly(A) polymerase/tRNA nucleotidyltransferase (CCA-adding enzyme)
MKNRFSPSLKPPPEVTDIIRRLWDAGFLAFVVGGAPRDALLERVIGDWDIATNAPCDRMMSLFSKAVPTGIKHGTVTVIQGNKAVEVSSFKGQGIIEDLSHRDFTINAMAYDLKNKRWIDPHEGLSDLKAGRVRAVVDALARFQEDPLRALRAIRIAVELDFKMSRDVWRTIPGVRDSLRHVAAERLREEFTRIMATPSPSRAFRWMSRTGLFKVLFPEFAGCSRKDEAGGHSVLECAIRSLDHLPQRALVRWAGLLQQAGANGAWRKRAEQREIHDQEGKRGPLAKDILERFRFSRKEIRWVTELIEHRYICRTDDLCEGTIRRLLLQFGAQWLDDLRALCGVDALAFGVQPEFIARENVSARIQRVLEETREATELTPVLDAEAVMEILNIPPGPKVGEILKDLLRLVTDDPSVNTCERLRSWLLEHRSRFFAGNQGILDETEI